MEPSYSIKHKLRYLSSRSETNLDFPKENGTNTRKPNSVLLGKSKKKQEFIFITKSILPYRFSFKLMEAIHFSSLPEVYLKMIDSGSIPRKLMESSG